MDVSLFRGEDTGWDDYVKKSDKAELYHLSGWKRVMENSFGNRTFYLMAKDNGDVKGVLPLVLLRSRLFGTFLVSLPFFDCAGICAENKEAEEILLHKAIDIAKKERAGHIEFRQIEEGNFGLPTKLSKVTMIMELNSDYQILWKGLKCKVRNQVRKAQRCGLTIKVGREKDLNGFYRVFALNMRDLGIPVHSKRLFENIMNGFPEEANIFSVLKDGEVIASGFTLGFKDTLQIPWASSIRKFNKFCPNNLLYWEIIKYGCEAGYRYFDFGRSTVDGGTYRFKKQWGARAKQLYWQYWLADGDKVPEINQDNPKYKLAIKLWQKLPLPATKIIGPSIVKNLS